MSDVSKQLVFMWAILHGSLSKFVLKSPYWKAVKRNVRKALNPLPQPENDTKEEAPSPPPVTTNLMSTLERKLFLDLLSTFYARVKTVKNCIMIERDENDNNDPVADVLEKACLIFIGCFNSYLSNMEGSYVEDYGVVKAEELRIQNVEAFSQILNEAVTLNFLPRKVKRVAENYLRVMSGEGEELSQEFLEFEST